VVRRALVGLGLAAIVAVGLAPVATADTFGSLTGDEDIVDVQFSRTNDGVREDWFVFALRDHLAGTTTISVGTYSERTITCRDGSDGSFSTFFDGSGPGSLRVGPSLLTAVGAAKVRGIQGSYNSCTDRSRNVPKSVAVSFAVGATGPLATYTLTQDILWPDDGVCYVLTQDFAGRDARGAALVDGRVSPTSVASINHSEWDSVPQAPSACESQEE
jgi:hypothetical protein